MHAGLALEEPQSMTPSHEDELVELLSELSTVQDDLLQVLAERRAMLVANDVEGLATLQQREGELVERLKRCHDLRTQLLGRAAQNGLPCDSLRSLGAALESDGSSEIEGRLAESSSQARLLKHHSLTNWVLVQRTLIHLSQLLEIIATGGRLQPTYGKGTSAQDAGSLVDRAA